MRALPLLLLALLPLTALAEHAPGPRCDPPNVGMGVITIGHDEDLTFYVDDRNFVTGGGIWLYEESNGIYDTSEGPWHGLQRGGSPWWQPAHPLVDYEDPCVDDPLVPPDTLWY